MRLPRVVARAALIAALASVVVPAVAGSRIPSALQAIDPAAFEQVDLGSARTTATTLDLDPAYRSDGNLEFDGVLRDPESNATAAVLDRPGVDLPATQPIVRVTWHLDNNISWYGPGFWGRNGACGMFGSDGLTPDDVGVAHRTLPCGTRVTFRYNGVTVHTRVVDRGPYVAGRIWDMTRGLCELLHHCFTGGGVYWRLG